MIDLRLSSYLVVGDSIVEDSGRRCRPLFATRTATGLTVDADAWRLVETGRLDAVPESLCRELEEAKVLVPTSEDELAAILEENEEAIAADDVVGIVVQPTAACQLGCTYCGQEHTSARICASHRDALVERTRARLDSGSTALDVGWFGAEPLLAIDEIAELTGRFRSLCKEREAGYRARVITNGLRLTPSMARRLVDLGVVSAEVTLDGLAEHHDRQRPYKSGRSSFGRVLDNLVDVAQAQTGLGISVRCNVTAESADSVPELIDLLADLGLQRDISLYFACVYSWGNDAHLMALTPERFAKLEINWKVRLAQRGFPISALPERVPIVCLAVSRSDEVVDATGGVFNCTEVSYVPSYGTPNEYSLGQIDGSIDEAKRDRLGGFNDRVRDGEVPCTTCSMLPVCGGGCPKAWIEGHDTCPPAKRNIKQRLLLQFGLDRFEPPEPTVRASPSEMADVLARFAPPLPAPMVTPVTLVSNMS